MDKLEATDSKIPNQKLNTYGQPVPVMEPIMTPDGFDDRKRLAGVIHKFFDLASPLAHIYKNPYVAVDRMQIYEMTRGEVTACEVNGLAQLLRNK